MKLHKDIKIELAASKYDTRYVITEPYLDVDKGVLVATNGMIIAVVPVECSESDKSGHVNPEALKAMRKQKVDGIECAEDWLSCGESKVKRSQNGNFPNWPQVIPSKDREIKFQVGLNIKALWELCQAIGCETARLEFSDNKDGVMVKPTTLKSNVQPTKPAANLDAYGVIMPIRLC